MINTIEKEIEECYNSTKDWAKYQTNQQYYKGLHDSYIHLMRFIGKDV